MIFNILILGYFFIAFEGTNAYVLLQVRKTDDNHSNVDALIHKVVSTEKFDHFAERIRKRQFSEHDQDKMDDDSSSSGLQIKMNNEKRAVLNFLGPSSMNPKNVKVLEAKGKMEPDIKELVNMVGKKIKKSKSGPVFRSKSDGYLFKPETVRLRTGRSSVYSLDSNSIAVAVKDVLESTALRAYLDKWTRKAAVAYTAVENDLMQQPLFNLLYPTK